MQTILRSWLDLVCQMLPGVSSGAIYLPESDSFGMTWQQDAEVPAELSSLAQAAEIQSAPVFVDKSEQSTLLVAFPLAAAGEKIGILSLSLKASGKQQEIVTQLLNWSQSWLELLVQNEPAQQSPSKAGILDLLEQALQTSTPNLTPTILVSLIAEYFNCSRVSLGLMSTRGIRVQALSHQAQFDARISLVGLMESAMEETLERGQIVISGVKDDHGLNLNAHEVLLKNIDDSVICSLPLGMPDKQVGALMLQRNTSFSAGEVTELEKLGRIIGPILALEQAARPGAAGKALTAITDYARSLFGPGAVAAKLWTIGIAGLIASLLILDGDFEVTANATLEGRTQQAIVTPFDGYIAVAAARAGDTVEKDQVLGVMDDKDLKFELQKVTNSREELTRQYRQALSEMNQSDARIFKSRIDQVDAQRSLLNHRLEQIELRTPIPGIILSGDLSRHVGAPVEKGDLLFEIAPLESYRIVLLVDESDISDIVPGLSGDVVLTSHPGQKIPFVIEHISSVLQDETTSGVVFKTEGRVQGEFDFLRPGMEGVARVRVGDRSLAWIMFRDFINWVRLTSWRWLP